MRELFLGTRLLTDQRGRVKSYDYHIVIDEMDVGPFSCESYGLQVTGRESSEASLVPHITCSPARIDELCRLVMEYGVTPSTLKDVVEDWL